MALLFMVQAKCEYYWPEAVEDELPQRDFDGFYVTLEKEDHFAEYVIRTLSVTKEVRRTALLWVLGVHQVAEMLDVVINIYVTCWYLPKLKTIRNNSFNVFVN